MPEALYLGLDIGTSGARAIAIDGAGAVRAEAKAAMADFGANHRAPAVWWQAARAAVTGALAQVAPGAVRAISVDGTSGTMLAIDAEGVPLADGLMYNDACTEREILSAIDRAAPADSAARGATSGLARALVLARLGPAKVVHQADWIAGQFSGRWVSDDNNALKTGFQPGAAGWPGWIAEAGLDLGLLPEVAEPGTAVGRVTGVAARDFGLSADTLVVAGTTDGCASFVATGADAPGDGVTALGTTMTIKMLSDVPVSAPEYGIYSHRVLGSWLVGGASNTGGNVLLHFFDEARLDELSVRIDPETDCPLDYYPLARPGERFPIADPALPPRLEPRPADDAEFLKGLLDGIARVEALAYRRLQELGAPRLASVRTVGGGAKNPVWTRLRERRLRVPMAAPLSAEAAYGAALLARRGVA
jgi:sugar (pentulose or hexulose) kinase